MRSIAAENPGARRRRLAALAACVALPTTIAAAHALQGGNGNTDGPVMDPAGSARSVDRSPLVLDFRAEVNENLRLRDHEIVTLPIFDEPGVPIRTPITIDGQLYTLDLVPTSVLSDNYRLLVQIDDGSYIEETPGPIRTMAGRLLELPGSQVAGSSLEDGLHLMIYRGDDTPRVWIEPASASSDQSLPDDHVMYTDDDMIPYPGTCGVTDENLPDEDEPQVEDGGQGGIAGACANPFWITEVAVDADHEMYLDFGGSVAAVEASISQIISVMNVQYQNDVGIRHTISTIIVRSSAADPYSNTTSPGTLLNQLESHWNTQQQGVQRDIVHMFTGRNLDAPVIGIANLSSICVTSNGYGLVMNIGGSLGCRTDLSAHELGHNWSADHCNCAGNTMNSSLTCANNFSATQTIPQIIAFRNTRNCIVNECVPSNDDCGDAITIGNGAFAYSTDLTFTDGPSDNLCAFNGDSQVGSDIWFRYVAGCDGDVTVDACSGPTYNAKIAVYDGGCPSLVNTALACDDDSCGGNRPQLTFFGENGVTYHIRVGGFESAQGEGTLTMTGPVCVPPPGNDNCGAATTASLGLNGMTTIGATTDAFDEAGCDGSAQIVNDVWYRYFALADDTLTVTADGDFDTKIAIYGSACPAGPDEALACNDAGGGNASSVSIPVTAFQLYRVRVGSADGSTGSGDVNFELGPVDEPCPGDTNGDDLIDIDDIVNVVLDFGCTQPPDCPNGGDVNGDDAVDIDDIVFVVLNFGAPCP